MTAQYKVHGTVAVITLDNPPVNGLGLATRQGITNGLSQVKRFQAAQTSKNSVVQRLCKSQIY
jgi:3-hydroxyacyl-CoA dehydrogenase